MWRAFVKNTINHCDLASTSSKGRKKNTQIHTAQRTHNYTNTRTKITVKSKTQ